MKRKSEISADERNEKRMKIIYEVILHENTYVTDCEGLYGNYEWDDCSGPAEAYAEREYSRSVKSSGGLFGTLEKANLKAKEMFFETDIGEIVVDMFEDEKDNDEEIKKLEDMHFFYEHEKGEHEWFVEEIELEPEDGVKTLTNLSVEVIKKKINDWNIYT